VRVTEVRTRLVRMSLDRPLGGSAARPPQPHRQLTVVEVVGEGGAVGYGESYGTPEAVAAIVRETLAPRVRGRDVRDVELVWDDLRRAIGYHGPGGVMLEALSGLDIALWDLKGKDLGVPLSVLLGGHRPEVPVYAASVYLDAPEAMAAQAGVFAAQGFDALKIKIGLDPETDLAAAEAVRRAIGPGVRMMVDANGAYDRRTAIRVGRLLDRLDAAWLEEPVATEDYEGYARVAQALDLPIAGGEGHYTRFGLRDLLVRGQVDIVQPDLTRCGGVGEARAAALMASAFGRRLSPHCWSSVFGLAAAAHLAAAMPNAVSVEYDAHPNPLKDALVGGQLTARDGRLAVPDRPGLGLEVDLGALERATVSLT
jgi:D-galactarolactone cycloisomerase